MYLVHPIFIWYLALNSQRASLRHQLRQLKVEGPIIDDKAATNLPFETHVALFLTKHSSSLCPLLQIAALKFAVGIVQPCARSVPKSLNKNTSSKTNLLHIEQVLIMISLG